jgi:hypothetical protein
MSKGGRRQHAGRKPKPTAIKLVTNTFRRDRHANEPQVTTAWPDPPGFIAMTDRQRTIWDGLKDSTCWHAQTDWPSVWMLVVAIDGLLANHDAQRETETSGHPLAFKHIIEEANGKSIEIVEAKENPLKAAELKYLDRIYKFVSLNGFSPADRARMPAVGEVEAENPLDKFIKRGRA